MFAVNLQVAVFFNNIVSRPDQLGNRMNAQMGNLFDAIPNTINLPPDVPDEIPLMQMSSTTSGNRLNVSRGRIDLFTSADPLEQVNLNRFIEMQEALVFSYFQALQNEKVVCNRLGLILTAFEESASAIEEIGKKYLTEISPQSSELFLRMNIPYSLGNMGMNNIIEITSGSLTNDVLGLDKTGIIYKRDINNIPVSDVTLTTKRLKEIWKSAQNFFSNKKMAEVV